MSLTILVGIIAACVVIQTAVIAGVALGLRKANLRFLQIAEELRSRLGPLITNVQILVEDSRPHLTNVFANAAEVTHIARNQAQRVDRVMGEALEHLRTQLAHIDRILTGTLEAVEDAGGKLRRSVLGPLVSVGALIRGVQTGVEFYRSRGRRRPPFSGTVDREQPDESLFI